MRSQKCHACRDIFFSISPIHLTTDNDSSIDEKRHRSLVKYFNHRWLMIRTDWWTISSTLHGLLRLDNHLFMNPYVFLLISLGPSVISTNRSRSRLVQCTDQMMAMNLIDTRLKTCCKTISILRLYRMFSSWINFSRIQTIVYAPYARPLHSLLSVFFDHDRTLSHPKITHSRSV